jgi:hypothetical protein
MDVKELGCEVVDWMHLAQNRVHWLPLMNMEVNLRVP